MEYVLQCVNTLPEDIAGLAVLAEECDFAGITVGRPLGGAGPFRGHGPSRAGSMPWDYSFSDVFVTSGAVLQATTRLRFAPKCAQAGEPDESSHRLEVVRDRVPDRRRTFRPRGRPRLDGRGVRRRGRGSLDARTAHNGRPDADIPIFIGAYVPESLRRAGRIGEGWMAPPETVDELAAAITIIDEARREAGRDSQPYEVFARPTRR